MRTYEELKAELTTISELLKLYPDSLQTSVFKLLIEEYLGRSVTTGSEAALKEESQQPVNQQAVRKKGPVKEVYRIVGELNLAGGDSIPSFERFYEEKQPESNLEFNTMAVYYLDRLLKTPNISANHIYTCYKAVSRKIPVAFRQSLYDTSSSLGSIDTKDVNSIVLTTRGENIVEHDLPRKKETPVPS